MVPPVPGQTGERELVLETDRVLSAEGRPRGAEVGVREGRAPPWPGPEGQPHRAARLLWMEEEGRRPLMREHLLSHGAQLPRFPGAEKAPEAGATCQVNSQCLAFITG